jgi:hypothetical protein
MIGVRPVLSEIAPASGEMITGGEGDAVRVDGPLQGREAGVQIPLHPRQGGDHDQRVEHHHEVGDRGQGQHPARPDHGYGGR